MSRTRNNAQLEGLLDWEQLRGLSLAPGGFGAERIHLWPQLLGVRPFDPQPGHADKETIQESRHCSESATEDASINSNHRDERQIQLDTDRSFVLYPADFKDRETLQTELQYLLLAVFRRRPKLCYFQGYHDIISVIYLTLPSELQLDCAEKLSLHRVRDSMSATLEPILGLLRILRNILRLADPSYASLLEQSSPLPYYALSNLLTLFSHDMPSLPLIQHVFDFLLCRPPIASVYLAAALVLSRRKEVERFQHGGEDGMVHSLLSGIPDLFDSEPPTEDTATDPMETSLDLPTGPSESTSADVYEPLDATEDQSVTSHAVSEQTDVSDITLVESRLDPPQEKDISDRPHSSQSPPDTPNQLRDDIEKTPDASANSISPSPLPHRPKITLTSLLTRADELYSLYPPTHPLVTVSSIMGPQSVLFTWSEQTSERLDDDEAEAIVTRPELIVRPYVEPEHGDAASPNEKKRRPQKMRDSGWVVERRTLIIAGAVVVIGIGLAVYGIKTRSTVTGGQYGRKIRTWIGKVLAGVE